MNGSDWDSSEHPRDWQGRFITTGVHVKVSGGLVGTVRGIQPGQLEGDPAIATVELPDGRTGAIPTDRLTVATPPAGHAWLGDGELGTIGDEIKLNGSDETGLEIKEIGDDGSITVGNVDDDADMRQVDPSTITSGDYMQNADDPSAVNVAESNVPDPPEDSAPQKGDLLANGADNNPILVGHSVISNDNASEGVVTGIDEDGYIHLTDMDTNEDVAYLPEELISLGYPEESLDDEPPAEAPSEEDLPPLGSTAAMFLPMAERASAVADGPDGDALSHDLAVTVIDSVLESMADDGLDSSDPRFARLQQLKQHHLDRKAELEYEENPMNDVSGDEPSAVIQDSYGADIKEGVRVEYLNPNGQGQGGVVEHVSEGGLVTYKTDSGQIRIVSAEEVRVNDPNAAPDKFFLPDEKDPADYADWGDRADTIAKSPGPKLDQLREGLKSNNRQELRDALHAAFNGEDGLGENGVTVKFDRVTKSDDRISFKGNLLDKEGNNVGTIERTIIYDENNPTQPIEVHNDYLSINPKFQGQGIAQDLYRNQEDWLIRENVPKVTILANIDVGGYAWARAGYDYASFHEAESHALKLKQRAETLYGPNDPTTKKLTAIHDQLSDASWNAPDDKDGNPDTSSLSYPTPFELSRIGWTPGAKTWPGKELMLGTHWNAVKYLRPPTNTGVNP